MNSQTKKISVVIPLYNEHSSIEMLVSRLRVCLKEIELDYEIIVVDDYSTDGTWEIVSKDKGKDLIVSRKKGLRGKAYSIVQGFEIATGNILVMIDGDLQYSPEAIVGMLKKVEDGADVVVSNRKIYKDSTLRRSASRIFRYVFGKFLFGIPYDIQSGLKLFKKRAWDTVRFAPKTPWSFDLEFLHKAENVGFSIQSFDIEFNPRRQGSSKISFIRSAFELGFQSILLRLKKINPIHIPSHNSQTMKGAGVGYRKKRYITHTTLHHTDSAIITLSSGQKFLLFFLIAIVFSGVLYNPIFTSQIIIGVLSTIYFIDVVFNLFLIFKSLHFPQEIQITQEEISKLNDSKLPVYSILCPLYREAHVVPQFVKALEGLDYPKDKLDVLLLLEEDDRPTIEALSRMSLPIYIRTIIVPDSLPRTKPKACNYGLSVARGEYLVIFDAEDIPDTQQLKKAILAFGKTSSKVICLQAKLNYYNPHQNILTRLFTAEYSLWFDITLTGLQSINTTIPLGGTSNHFRTVDLIKLQGWDPFNVTEDADLGIRLFKKGYTTAIIDSTTLEEANSDWKNWLRQRSRWIKGYMQTYLVHMRQTPKLIKTLGPHAAFFQLVIGGKIAFIMINPLLWIATVSYFALHAYVGETIETLYPSWIFYLAAISLVFGNFLFLYYYMIGCVKKGQWELVKFVFLIPFYWLMISVAGLIAFYQLLFKPHYWEKTIHGLHLSSEAKRIIPQLIDTQVGWSFPNPFRAKFPFERIKSLVPASFLVFATITANILNLIFNMYLGRELALVELGALSLFSSFLYFAFIPFGGLSSTISYRSAFLDGRFGGDTSYTFWKVTRVYGWILAAVVSVVWCFSIPFLTSFFPVSNYVLYILFLPILILGFAGSVDRGYATGKLWFGILGISLILEAAVKLVVSIIVVQLGIADKAFFSIPIGFIAAFTYLYITILRKNVNKVKTSEAVSVEFPIKFFAVSLLSGISTISFLTLDVILASHFLSSQQAGQYALVSLVGKMIFFLGSLSIQFVTPLVARAEGEQKNTNSLLNSILILTTLLSGLGFVGFGVFGNYTILLLFGEKSYPIIPYLIPFSFAMLCFTVSRVFVSYYLTKKLYTFPIISFLITFIQIGVISIFHSGVGSIVWSMALIGQISLLSMVGLHLAVGKVKFFESNFKDFLSIFEKSIVKTPVGSKTGARILIFNWRDITHKWAGGAEVYVQELAKRWVRQGNQVTIFCGNDGHHSRNAVMDGVTVIRRGGFYTVYIWAFIYYLLRLRGKFDVVIDSENGIPFFTPLFVRVPKILLIYHIHQDVFQKHLVLPFALLASFLEQKLMPFLYKNEYIITISESSKKEIQKLGLGKRGIDVVSPGIDTTFLKLAAKTTYPSLVYLGRIKPYKNIDIAIKSFARIVTVFPNAKLTIAGEGEALLQLKKLAQSLNIFEKINFIGKISEKEKGEILAKNWIAIQPSQVEGWGITVIEANACGTPVIASDVNGLKDSVINGKTGLLVRSRSVDDATRAIIEIFISSALRNTLSENAYEWSGNFSWDKSAHDFIKILARRLESYASQRAASVAVVES